MTWRPVYDNGADAGVWLHQQPSRGCWVLGTIAVRLRDGALAIYSPTAGLSQEDLAALRPLGEPRLFIAPNHYHHLGLPDWRSRHPELPVVAAEAAHPRLRKQRRDVTFLPPEAVAGELPAHVRFVAPPARNGELWLLVETAAGRALVVCDAFMNVSTPPRGFTGMALRLIKASPGLTIATTFGRVAVGAAAPFRAFTEAFLAAERPTLLVPCHGDPLHDPALPETLTELMARRFG